MEQWSAIPWSWIYDNAAITIAAFAAGCLVGSHCFRKDVISIYDGLKEEVRWSCEYLQTTAFVADLLVLIVELPRNRSSKRLDRLGGLGGVGGGGGA